MTATLTVLAGITLLVSGACLGVFFSTGRDQWGRANDATTALWALLMTPVAFEIYARYGERSRWIVGTITACALAGELVIAATSGLTAAALLDWRRSATIGAVGFAGFLAWMAGVSGFALALGEMPEALAWFGLVALAATGAAVVLGIRLAHAGGFDEPRLSPPGQLAVFTLAFLCFPAWCIWLGLAL